MRGGLRCSCPSMRALRPCGAGPDGTNPGAGLYSHYPSICFCQVARTVLPKSALRF